MSAGIPIIGQTVATPNLPPRPRPPLEQVPDVGRNLREAGAGIEQAGGQLARVVAVQAQHQRTLDIEDRTTQYTNDLHNAHLDDTTKLPGNQWGQSLTDTAKSLQDAMLESPANAHIKADLAEILPRIAGRMTYEATEAGAVQTARAQHDQRKLIGEQDANIAGADYVINSDGSIGDGPSAKAAISHYQNLLNQVPNAANDVDLQLFKQQVAQQRALAIAQKGPASQPGLLDRFIKDNPGALNQAQIEHAYTTQIAALTEPFRAANAAHEAVRAQKIQQLDQMAANHDPNLAAAASDAVRWGWATEQEFRNYTGTKWRDPGAGSDPSYVASVAKGIADRPFAYSEADIAALDKDSVSPQDRAKLKAQLYDTQKAAKQTIGSEYYNSRELIKEAMAPGIVNVNPEATRLRTEAALSDLETPYKDGHFEKAQDVIDMRNKIIQQYTKGRPARAPLIHVGAPLTPEQVKAAADEARRVGFTGGGAVGGSE